MRSGVLLLLLLSVALPALRMGKKVQHILSALGNGGVTNEVWFALACFGEFEIGGLDALVDQMFSDEEVADE
jgi:hypothetical protein